MKIIKLTTRDIIRKIDAGLAFEAEASDAGFYIKVGKYVPFVCMAIHNGNRLRPELKRKTALSDYERWFEEDPNTGDLISSMPIVLSGLDSRFEYDLNRPPEECIYETAWGKTVWKKKLSATEIRLSRQKHARFFEVVHALISKLEEMFEACLVYDIHSYNYVRWEREVPLFNIGTEMIDRTKHRAIIKHWIKELNNIKLPETEVRVAENDVFKGQGYNLNYIGSNFKNTLVLATEVKKVYCNELSGDLYPAILGSLQRSFKKAILNNANFFSATLEKWHYASVSKLLDQKADETLLKVDRALYSLLNNFELLAVVNPVNSRSEKKKFLQKRHSVIPDFRYTPVKINPFRLKQQLMSVPVQDIHDISLQSMYQSVVNSYFDKIDMIAALDSNKFHYNSLRYFGRPSKKDLSNALYIMHLPDIPGEAKSEPVYSADEAMDLFRSALMDYGLEAKIESSKRVISQIMTLHSKRKILFQPEAKFKRKELFALIDHEIGIHLLTTVNSGLQPLKIFSLGLPVNTETQEGLAVLSEYLGGNITLKRIKKLALRVIAVDMMCSGADFIECFRELVNTYRLDENDAFNMVARTFRGGGFTKDYLYLTGFVKILRLYNSHYDLSPLLVGKTSLGYLGTIEEMIGREMIKNPVHVPHVFIKPRLEDTNPIYNYILSGLR